LHHAIFRVLYSIFDKSFIRDSYSCRINKGTHRAINRLNDFARKVGRNNTRTCFVLKCDVKKYFDSIDQEILIDLLKNRIKDNDAVLLLTNIIKSFPKGLPLGNITIQLFANIYLGELDKFIKHKIKAKYYARYCDDFVILDENYTKLKILITAVNDFLNRNLKLHLHPNKMSIKKYHQGIDFLGYVSFPYFRILRTKTKNRIIQKVRNKEIKLRDCIITKKCFNQTIQSYLGVLKHCDSYKIRKETFSKFLGMIIFLYGKDLYRAREKLNEIIDGYKKVHKSGLNLIWINAKEKDFRDFLNNFKIVSMFAEKKLVVLKNVFLNKKFEEDLLEEVKNFKNSKDIVVVFSAGGGPASGGENIDQRNKLFKELKKEAKSQEFDLLSGVQLRNWIRKEAEKNNAKFDEPAEGALLSAIGNDLWQTANEIKKLADYKRGKIIKKEDVEAMIKPRIETDIFKTIDAIASKNKSQALAFLKKHLEAGDNPLQLLSMFAYQFRNLLVIKELIEKQNQYPAIVKKSGLHPFVVKKTFYLCNQFSFDELKKIYRKIFQIDLDIKTGKADPELALELFITGI